MEKRTKIILAVVGLVTLGLGITAYFVLREKKGSGEVSAGTKKNTIIFVR